MNTHPRTISAIEMNIRGSAVKGCFDKSCQCKGHSIRLCVVTNGARLKRRHDHADSAFNRHRCAKVVNALYAPQTRSYYGVNVYSA